MMETDHESIPPSEALIHEESEIDATGETEAKPDSPMEVRTESGKMEEGQLQGGDYRVKLDNVPRFVGSSQMKKFLKSQLPASVEFRKLKVISQQSLAFFSLPSEEQREVSVAKLNGIKIKKYALKACKVEPQKFTPAVQDASSTAQTHRKTATEIACPLAHLSYASQLEWKQKQSEEAMKQYRRQAIDSGVVEAHQWKMDSILKPILPSPVTTAYRNKCEFSIGREEESGLPVVGFVASKMADRRVTIAGVEDCLILTKNTRAIVAEFQKFIREFEHSSLAPYDEFAHTGFWRMLTVRDFSLSFDCMVIVSVCQSRVDSALVTRVKEALCELFFHAPTDAEKVRFRVTSLYWNVMEMTGDERHYELIGGAPYVYERMTGGERFRISPATFFQTNTRAAEVLYDEIGNALGLEQYNSNSLLVDQKDVTAMETVDKPAPSPPTILLDICCGAGTIGIACLRRVLRPSSAGGVSMTPPAAGSQSPLCVIGVESVAEAVEDARRNVKLNGLPSMCCLYAAGAAEQLFKNPHSLLPLPKRCDWEKSAVMGVLDPPRAGVGDRVIIACRKLSQLKRLVYVSCDPRGAMKNLVDLCRVESQKFQGSPFRLTAIQPVDMFPATRHYEWVITYERD